MASYEIPKKNCMTRGLGNKLKLIAEDRDRCAWAGDLIGGGTS